MRNLVDIVETSLPADMPPRAIEILRTAARLFAVKGFADTSMRDISAECGLSKATLYHYFSDKDAIVRPLVLGTTRSIYERVVRADKPDASGPERLRIFMRESATFFQEFRWAWMAGSDLFWTDPEARQKRERLAWRDRYEQHLQAIFQQGVTRQEFAIADIHLAGRMVLGSLNWLPRWFRPDGPMHASEIAERFCDMLLGGLQPVVKDPINGPRMRKAASEQLKKS